MSKHKGAQTKQHILDSAMSFIVREGIEKVGVNKVIQEAQVSKGSFYHSFNDMKHLMKELAIYAFEKSLQDLSIPSHSSLEDIVEHLGLHIFHSVRNKSQVYYLLFLCISKSFIDSELKETFQGIFNQLVQKNSVSLQIVQRGNQENLKVKIHSLDMLVLGFIVHCHFLEDEEHLLTIWKHMTSHILE
ncbi:MAG: TetR/AcrR family transcriptional regulator [Bacillota bacterium]|nr:TetR/AcrR family transcriptional regulator [Bacillota bacterium]